MACVSKLKRGKFEENIETFIYPLTHFIWDQLQALFTKKNQKTYLDSKTHL